MEAYKNKTHYQILGVDERATKEEIKQAFRDSSKKYHPDSNKSGDFSDLFNACVEAKSILLDDKKRLEYDDALSYERYGLFGEGGLKGTLKREWQKAWEEAGDENKGHQQEVKTKRDRPQKKYNTQWQQAGAEKTDKKATRNRQTVAGESTRRPHPLILFPLRILWVIAMLAKTIDWLLFYPRVILMMAVFFGSTGYTLYLLARGAISLFSDTTYMYWQEMLLRIGICAVAFIFMYWPINIFLHITCRITVYLERATASLQRTIRGE